MARKLEIEFVGDTSKLNKAFGQVKGDAKGLGKDMDDAGKRGSGAMKGLKIAMGALGGVAVFQGLKSAVGAAIGEFEEARKVGAQTEAVIKSTGGAAKVTAKDVSTLAGAISRKAGIDDEAIQSGQNVLLTFTKIRNETGAGNKIFNEATKVTTDLSVALGKDMKSSAILVGKALNDPVKGATALSRAGVQLTEQQKEQIKKFTESGNVLGAQKVILKELETQFGGSAAAQATASDKMKVALGNLAEAAGAILVPAIDKISRFLSTFVNQMIEGQSVGGALVSTFRTTGSAIGDVIGAVVSVVGWFRQHQTVSIALGAALGTVLAALIAIRVAGLVAMLPALAATVAQFIALNIAMLANPAVLIVAGLAALAAAFIVAYRESETFRNIVNGVWAALKTAGTALIGFVTDLQGMPGKLANAGKWLVERIIDGIKALPGLLAAAGGWILDRAVDGFKAAPGVLLALGGWVKNRLMDGLSAAVSAYLALGGWILNRIWDGIKAAPEVILQVGGWLKNRILDGLGLAIEAIKGLGGWILRRIWEGVLAAPDTIVQVGGWLKNRVLDGLNAAIDAVRGLGGWMIRRVWEGVQAVPDAITQVGGWLKNRIMDGLETVKKGIMGLGGTILDWIVDGLKAGANKFIDFLNSLISVINKLPGVDIGKIEHFARGGSTGAQGLAAGGQVTKPIVMMGEEAPRHPEWVIPTNPAYRDRAKMLLGRAAESIGVGIGGPGDKGFMSQGEIEGLARKVFMPKPALMAAIAMAESGGDIDAFGPPSGRGLWQIEWDVWGKRFAGRDPNNPLSNAVMAKTVLAEQGLGAWVAYTNGSYRQFLGKGQSKFGALGKVPGIIGDLISKGVGFLLDQLPGVGDLPGWIQGLGKHVLGKIGGWIKGKVEGLIGAGGGGDLGDANPSFEAVNALAKRFGNDITSGFRPGDPGWHGANRARDYAGGDMLGFARMVAAAMGSRLLELIHTPLGFGVKNGKRVPPYATADHYDHVHVALAKGGLLGKGTLPFVGSYHDGGFAPAEGLAHVVRGEEMIPPGQPSSPMVVIEHAEIGSTLDAHALAHKLAFRIATAAG